MDLSIIIVNWKSVAYLGPCLRSIYAGTAGLAFEVIVIDNASFDGSDALLSREFPSVRFIQSATNDGFARANNRAALGAKGSLLLFLNPDTELHESALSQMVRASRLHSDAGVLGPRLLNTDGSLQTSCIQAFPSILNQFLDADVLRRWFPRLGLWGVAAFLSTDTSPKPVESLSGACMLTPRAIFERVGGFTEDYFMYFEDADYCLKSSRAGFRSYYVPEAAVVHHGGKSSGGGFSLFSSVMMAESGSRYFRLRWGFARSLGFRLAIGAKAAIRIGLLACAWPFARLLSRSKGAGSSLRKWVSVLQWSLGDQRWAARLRPLADTAIAPSPATPDP